MCEFCHHALRGWSRRNVVSGALALLSATALPLEFARGDQPASGDTSLVIHQPPGYDFKSAADFILEEHSNFEEFYQAYFDGMTRSQPIDNYGLALANQVVGLLRNDPTHIIRAGGLYETRRDAAASEKERRLAGLGASYCRYILTGKYPSAVREPGLAEPVQYMKEPPPTGDFRTIILGRSVIRVRKGALIKTQVDRVTRDWLLAFHAAGVPWNLGEGSLFRSHEGARLTQLAEFAGGKIVPVWGTKATKVGEKWYAPDADGIPKFEISEDKVNNHPSTIVVDDHAAILNDTHGVSALAWDALDASLVVACGDHKGKMDAAYYLADRGVDVYTPFDRFMGFLIGARTNATIIGSAPIKKTSTGAEIGNQPVALDIDEPIVVSNAVSRYPLQYYDTPYRYFTCLRDYIGRPLKLIDVKVSDYEKATNVVDAARQTGSKVLGIRVKSKVEHHAVADWLRENSTHRAVLFHTAGYPGRAQLFTEFPAQTTFGDVRPVFE